MDTISFDYKPRWLSIVLGVAFFSVCTAVLMKKAATNENALNFNGILSFSQSGASFIYGVLAFGAACFVVIGLAVLVRSFDVPKQVVLGPRSVKGPKSGLKNTQIEITYREVVSHVRHWVGGQELVSIRGSGTKLVISKSMFLEKAGFAEFWDELTRRCKL